MNKWNPFTIAAEAKKYSTKSAFTTGSQRAAKKAKELGIYELVCGHMDNKYKLKSDEDLRNDALKYSTRGEFQLKSAGSYTTARTRGILEEICRHMKNKHENWSFEKVQRIAKKYSRRVDFQINDANAYAAAKRNDWLDEVCEHMSPVYNSWTAQELREEALKYEFRIDFQYESKGAYLAAQKRGLLEEICSHMTYKDGSTQLVNEMYMYYIRIDTLDSSLPPVWKIGITKYKDPMRRFKREISVVKTKITVLKTWYFSKGYDAAKAERNVMETYKQFAYIGDSPLRETKTTEMFNEDILKLEVCNG